MSRNHSQEHYHHIACHTWVVQGSSTHSLNLERYWLDNVLCEGNESELINCRHDGWGAHDCTEEETAGVICARQNVEELLSTPSTTIASVPLKKMEVRYNVVFLLNAMLFKWKR